MKNRPFRQILSLVLVAAFLMLQWSSLHIHLGDAHEHDGGQHQHANTLHQHQFASHHEDALDVAELPQEHNDSSKIVELDQDCRLCKGQLSDSNDYFTVLSSFLGINYLSNASLGNNFITDSYLTYLSYSSVRLRAPPVIS